MLLTLVPDRKSVDLWRRLLELNNLRPNGRMICPAVVRPKAQAYNVHAICDTWLSIQLDERRW